MTMTEVLGVKSSTQGNTQGNTQSSTQGQVLTSDDPGFPLNLHYVEAPPKCLFVLGGSSVLSSPSLAIVGARKATPYGLSCANRFARLAALRGITVVSGGAIGCDQAAHRGALEAGGKTVVVLGCGADVVYPAGAKALFDEVIREGGALASEAPWGSSPSRWGFRRRNRIIAGLAQATLIVEAGLPSGTFSTADAALAQGKEVLAIPGSIYAQESKGANRLIAQGAIPIVDDEVFCDAISQIFGMFEIPETQTTRLPDFQIRTHEGAVPHALAALLSQQPRRAEELTGVCGDDVIEVIRFLSTLELKGVVTRLRDGRYSLVYQ